jgi:hypothetical protein
MGAGACKLAKSSIKVLEWGLTIIGNKYYPNVDEEKPDAKLRKWKGDENQEVLMRSIVNK